MMRSDENLNPSTSENLGRVQWDMRHGRSPKYEAYWKDRFRSPIPDHFFSSALPLSIEIGAGSGGFFEGLSRLFPKQNFVAIERCRERAKALVRRMERSGLENFLGIRGNAIPMMIHAIPSESVDRLFILYPCPWPKNSQRKNRWYFHPIMPHCVRTLKKGGAIIWASDQQFYIEEARYVCEQKYSLKTLHFGELSPNPYNHLGYFSQGRSKFEQTFLSEKQPLFELISQRMF